MGVYPTIEHYLISYQRRMSRPTHNIWETQKFYAAVVFTGLEMKDAHPWKFWRWAPYFKLAEAIEKDHVSCCEINSKE